MVHQYGGRYSTKTSGSHVAIKALTFAPEIKYMCLNTSPTVRERLKLLRFIGIDIFFNQIAFHHGVTQGDNSEMCHARSWKIAKTYILVIINLL